VRTKINRSGPRIKPMVEAPNFIDLKLGKRGKIKRLRV